jgi:hypothetical protein
MDQQSNRPDDYQVPRTLLEDDSRGFETELDRIRSEALRAATETHTVNEQDVDQARVEFGGNVVDVASRAQPNEHDVIAPEVAAIELPTDPASLIHVGRLVIQMRSYELPEAHAEAA